MLSKSLVRAPFAAGTIVRATFGVDNAKRENDRGASHKQSMSQYRFKQSSLQPISSSFAGNLQTHTDASGEFGILMST